jgi:hypothetical protein
MRIRTTPVVIAAGIFLMGLGGTASGQSAPAAPASVTLLAPGMNGVLAWPTTSYALDTGPLGKWYVDAALTGLAFGQTNTLSADRSGAADLSNGQVFLQKVDGWWQFYVQAGAYSIPVIGAPYAPNDVDHALNNYYGVAPQAFLKLAPTDNTYIEAGKLPALIGAESTFTFENMNVQRGLLWNEEPAVSRGVQAGITLGPVTVNVSLNDGFYSNRYTWITGSAAWTINATNTLTLAAGGNTGSTAYSSIATPVVQNNSSIYNIIYTYNAPPFIITPYLQWQHAESNAKLGFLKNTDAWSGALLVSYAVNGAISFAGRVEYISTGGSASDGAANFLYGPGSNAFTATVTPTYAWKRFYIRPELSYVAAASITPGEAFGKNGTNKNQFRGLLEAGVLF